jgi:hypothetical protein
MPTCPNCECEMHGAVQRRTGLLRLVCLICGWREVR